MLLFIELPAVCGTGTGGNLRLYGSAMAEVVADEDEAI